MAELDTEEIVETPEIEEETIEIEESSDDDITYEQAMEWKKKAESLAKAEAKIVELKKTTKSNPAKTENKTETNQDLELRLFFIENPELKEDKDGIMEILSQEKYNTLTPLEAREIYNLNKPKQSESKQGDFGGGSYIPKPKTLGEMSDEDALKLSPTDYIKRLKARGEL